MYQATVRVFNNFEKIDIHLLLEKIQLFFFWGWIIVQTRREFFPVSTKVLYIYIYTHTQYVGFLLSAGIFLGIIVQTRREFFPVSTKVFIYIYIYIYIYISLSCPKLLQVRGRIYFPPLHKKLSMTGFVPKPFSNRPVPPPSPAFTVTIANPPPVTMY